MNKELQKIILGIIKNRNGIAKQQDIFNKVTRQYWPENKEQTGATNAIIQHELDLLDIENKVNRKDQSSNTPYTLTLSGEQVFDPWYKKTWRFFTDDLAKILSVISLVISIIASLIVWFK